MSRLENLRSISYPHPTSTQLKDLYATCVLAYRESINSIVVGDEEGNSSQLARLTDKLRLFSALSAIELRKRSYDYVKRTEEIVDQFTNIKAVNFKTFPCNAATINTRNVNPENMEPAPHIEEIIISCLAFTNDKALLYFINKYPNLKSLKINKERDIALMHPDVFEMMASTQNKLSPHTIAQFLAFVNKILTHNIQRFYTTTHIASTVKNYWKLCDSNTVKTLELKYDDCNDFVPYHVNSKFSAEIQMDNENDNKFSSTMGDTQYPVITYNTIGKAFPHLDVIEKIGKLLTRLVFGISTRFNVESVKDSNDYLALMMSFVN